MNKILSYAFISNFVAFNSKLTADVTIPHSYIHYRREKYSIKMKKYYYLIHRRNSTIPFFPLGFI